ncbi:type IV toxin-antitoxin system AbiEi family antitoxin domain-containing protein [Crossiella sp. CA-258035]|uniref:type IV toxin-antitoxin system AbiEi family antitoxin domain-containing protein n=1 Tax=Crossiella sp. CA-258035 TaxID=2981138 RepID=UPI0024BC3F39|nr:type IV toxin-antitoxin system AbiEi family antitoxin domain-containing protein [Crossiella sp. CA-258035]WHT18763.1 type IV toxin-antitoxin system AbiEi family antitoxin domain-containing protein [Crossiella sp. CA-258035]
MVADPAELRRALNATALRQAGYFTAQQARAAGYSHQAQNYHVKRGNWTRVGRGLFRLPDWPETEHEEYVRWRLWSGDRAVVSHESALLLHELSDVNPSAVHLTVPPGFRATAPNAVLHKESLPQSDVEERAEFRVTTVQRTLLDTAAGTLSQEQLDTAVSDALDRGLVTPRQLRTRADRHGERAALRIERALGAANR